MSKSYKTFFVCILVLLLSLGWATFVPLDPRDSVQAESGVVKFFSDPPGVTISQWSIKDNHVLGLSNSEPIRLEDIQGDARPEISFSKDGYKRVTETISRDKLKSGVWPGPQEEILRLQPESLQSRLSYLWEYRRIASLAALFSLLGAGFSGYKMWKESLRHRLLEEYIAASNNREHVGAVISEYRIVEFIAEGGFGQVFKALPDATLNKNQPYAIKLMKLDDQELARRFDREMRLCERLDHDNIIRVIEYGHHQGLYFIVMEFVSGQSLGDRFESAPLAKDEILRLFKQVAEGLSYAHDKDIIHRDLKPDNVQINTDGKVKLLDFGLAREVGKEDITRTEQTIGTLQYMAPEQMISTRTAGKAADQYSFGLLVYEALCGELPFDIEGKTAPEVLHVRLTQPEEPLKSKDPKFAGPVSDTVERMLHSEPDKRFDSVAEAFAALEKALKNSSL